MLSPSQAVKNALATTRNVVGRCDQWVAQYYGYSSSGYATAITHWNSIDPKLTHPGDSNPPPGALVFWSGGSSGAGHVALSTGNGNVVSTDYPRSGITSETSINSISNGWGERYMGWSSPVFQGQSGTTLPAGFSIPNPLGGLAGGSILDFITGQFGSDAKDLLQRAGLILFGAMLIIIGLFNMQSHTLKAVIKSNQKARATAKKEANDAVDETGKETEEGARKGVREVER